MSLILNRIRSFFGGRRHEADLESEMSAHLELAIQDNLRRGLPPDEARRQALARFGGIEQAREQHRANRGFPALETLLQDSRYALRTFRRDRGFAITAILILALGIGANVTVFSVVNNVLLRPLPFRDPARLTWLAANGGKGGLSGTTYTVAAFQEFQRHNHSFESVTAFQTFYDSLDYKLTGHGEPQSLSVVEVAGNFFPTLGVQPMIGRLFTEGECQKGGRKVALLTYPFWQRNFAGNRAIIGQSVRISDEAVTVVGVLPNSFDFGSVFSPGRKVDLFVPAVMDFWRTWGNTLALVGRLKPGVTVGRAQAESNVLFPQFLAAHKDWFEDYKATITPLKDYVSGKLRRSLIVLWCAVGMVLLIVCVNLSNLLLARSAARSKEFAMRSALGAGRARLVTQLLTESLILSAAGSFLGLCIAWAVTRYLAHQGSIALPLLSSVRVDGAALGWTLLIALSATLLFGLMPAFRMAGANLQDSLKDAAHGMSQSTKHERLRSALVVSEVALACVLLVGAGLLLRSFLHVLDVDLGFQPEHVSAIKLDYDDHGSADRRGAIFHEILDRVNALPGIEAAGVTDMLPLDRNRSWGFQAKGRIYRPGELDGMLVYVVTPDYLRAMGMHLLAGRDFNWRDRPDSSRVVIINQATARFHFPGQNPVGRMAQVNGNDTVVVGVIGNVHESSVEESPNPEMYLPITQAGPEGADLVLRTSLSPAALRLSVMRALRSLNPGQPANDLRPIQRIVDHAISPRRFFVLLVTIFAALALLLASLGIYGVISYSVTRQTQEIGIRMALGATQADVLWRIIRRTMRLALYGIAAGTVVSFAVARLIASLLFGITSTDPLTFGAMAALLIAVAMLGGYLPARRAARIHPMSALRTA